MHKIALLAALLTVAAFPSTSIAAQKEDPAVAATRNTAKLMRDGMMPYAVTAKAAPAPKARKAKKSKKKAKKR